jgi:hypothetical protein
MGVIVIGKIEVCVETFMVPGDLDLTIYPAILRRMRDREV